MTAAQKINELVETRINGNQIRGDKTYERMLKSVRKSDIHSMGHQNGVPQMYGDKLDLIQQLVNFWERR